MLNDINNFIKWLVLKPFIINKVSNATKIASVFVFLYESYFLLGQFCFKCHLKIPNKTRVNILLRKIFIKHYKFCYARQKYCKFMQKRNRAKHITKNIILKGKITTTCIEHKHKNTGTNVLIHPQNVEKQYH